MNDVISPTQKSQEAPTESCVSKTPDSPAVEGVIPDPTPPSLNKLKESLIRPGHAPLK